MIGIVVVGLIIVVPVAWVVWRTIGRSMVKLSSMSTETPVGPALNLVDESVAVLEGVRVREIVRWEDDLLVGFSGGTGSWTDPAHDPDSDLPILGGRFDIDGQIRFVRGAVEPRTRRLLDRWRAHQLPLVATLGQDGTFALSDHSTREAILGETVGPKP